MLEHPVTANRGVQLAAGEGITLAGGGQGFEP